MTAFFALTGWTVIVAVLLRANHLLHRKPTPEPTPWFVTDGLWTYPDPDAPEVNWMPLLPPVPNLLADQPVDVLSDAEIDARIPELEALLAEADQ